MSDEIHDNVQHRLVLIGDIHTNYSTISLAQNLYEDCGGPVEFLQLGDFGMGFVDPPKEIIDDHRLIALRGNHDNPSLTRELQPPFVQNWDLRGNALFISGAESRDQSSRIEGLDWWRDEEMNYANWNSLYDRVYEHYQSGGELRYIFSHDAPLDYVTSILRERVDLPSRTQGALQYLVNFLHENDFIGVTKGRPTIEWYHGHYHRNKLSAWRGIKMTSLGIDQLLEIQPRMSYTSFVAKRGMTRRYNDPNMEER